MLRQVPAWRTAPSRLLAILALLLVGPLQRAGGFSPESPEVQQLIQRGAAYLQQNPEGPNASLLGCRCLVGLTFYKNGESETHPLVAAAIKQCRDMARSGGRPLQLVDNYSLSLAIVFLCELDPAAHRSDIETLLQELFERQKPHGGWGYAAKLTGDTSQTQYTVLACWSAYRAGMPVSQDSMERVCNWLLRTQDPNGDWGYQGKDPGEGVFTRVRQDAEVSRLSLQAAALGSLYIAADMLRLTKRRDKPPDNGHPPALKLVREGQQEVAGKPLTDRVPTDYLQQTLALGNQSLARRFQIQTTPWQYYYLYALERYMSFRELAEGAAGQGSTWYDQGVRFLMSQQAADGGFTAKPTAANMRSGVTSDGGPVADTAFALLFLMRSTQRSIQKNTVNDGLLAGGRGLPRDTSEVHLDGGNVVRAPVFGQVEDLLSILENPDSQDFDDLVRFNDALTLGQEESARQSQLERLAKLVSQGEYRARRLAVRSLARSGDLAHAPVLIYALSDPDPRVVQEARDGLRFLSRRLQGFGLPDRPTEAEARQAIEQWKQWYLSIEPNAVFLR